MEDNTIFNSKVDVAVNKKIEWYNNVDLPGLLEKFRIVYTCVKNLNEMLIQKGIIQADPYKLDRRISEIAPLDTAPFPDSESTSILGARLSEYEMMLDFICTYYRFTIDNMPSSKIKILLDISKTFDWSNLSLNNTSSNTRSLAQAINDARMNATAMITNNLSDSTDKCKSSTLEICKKLLEINDFQKEVYKAKIRKDILENAEFDRQKAYSSPEEEMAEIKRLYTKVTGKRNLNTDAVNELIMEDQGRNAQALRDKLLVKLSVKEESVVKETKGPDPKTMLIQAVQAMGALAPTLNSMILKIQDNFDLLFFKKKTFFTIFIQSLKQALGIKEKERICNIPIVDSKTGNKTMQKVQVQSFLNDLQIKNRMYNGFGTRGVEYTKICNADEKQILSFVNKQISENQSLFTIINALDDYFKANVEILLRPKVKGLKIDLSTYRNAIIAVNKKRGEYLSYKEEQAQYEKLGISK